MIWFWNRAKIKDSQIAVLSAKSADLLARFHAQNFARGWNSEEFEDLLTQGSIVCLGLKIEKKLAGFLLLRFAADEVEVLTVAIDRSFRGAGLGEKLLRHGFDLAKQKQARHAHLEVEAGNTPALRLYDKLGFQEAGRRRGYYVSSGDADALIMSRVL